MTSPPLVLGTKKSLGPQPPALLDVGEIPVLFVAGNGWPWENPDDVWMMFPFKPPFIRDLMLPLYIYICIYIYIYIYILVLIQLYNLSLRGFSITGTIIIVTPDPVFHKSII